MLPKCPFGAQKSKIVFIGKIIWPCSTYVIVSFEKMDGCMKGSITKLEFLLFLLISAFFGVLLRAPHHRPFFAFDNIHRQGAYRLSILVSFPIRAHAFQSLRCYYPKIVLAAVPGEMGCQSPRLIVSYYPHPHTGEREQRSNLCDRDQYIITFLSPQWHYQGMVHLHRPAISKECFGTSFS